MALQRRRCGKFSATVSLSLPFERVVSKEHTIPNTQVWTVVAKDLSLSYDADNSNVVISAAADVRRASKYLGKQISVAMAHDG